MTANNTAFGGLDPGIIYIEDVSILRSVDEAARRKCDGRDPRRDVINAISPRVSVTSHYFEAFITLLPRNATSGSKDGVSFLRYLLYDAWVGRSHVCFMLWL